MNVHDVTISRSELMTVRAGGQVPAMTNKGLEVLIGDPKNEPEDKVRVEGRRVVWLPITDFMSKELLEKGSTGFSPDYATVVFGIRLDT
ncbi:hypothetical protein [Micromonospora chalcea]|uniref:hypothetical protein n=1 Tax=Micromonospora chalcea TaxID=1874 RepID=UPI003D733E62